MCSDHINASAVTLIPTIGYIQVRGHGASNITRSATLVEMTSLNNKYELGSIDVSEDGTIFVQYYSLGIASSISDIGNGDGYYSYNNEVVFVKPGGINGLLDGSLIGPRLSAISNQATLSSGGDPGLGTAWGQNSTNVRVDIPFGVRGLRYDNKRKVLYQIMQSFDPPFTGSEGDLCEIVTN